MFLRAVEAGTGDAWVERYGYPIAYDAVVEQ